MSDYVKIKVKEKMERMGKKSDARHIRSIKVAILVSQLCNKSQVKREYRFFCILTAQFVQPKPRQTNTCNYVKMIIFI